jgi:hypothetical protein
VTLDETDGQPFVRAWWHWWFFGQTEKPAERVINLDPDAWYRTPSPAEMGEDNHADLCAALRNPAVVHGMCEDYRAGLRVDRAHEEADRAAGRQIACPMLLLAATEDDINIHGDAEAIWRSWVAGELRSAPIHSGTTRPNRHPRSSHRLSFNSSAFRQLTPNKGLLARVVRGPRVGYTTGTHPTGRSFMANRSQPRTAPAALASRVLRPRGD